MGKCVCCGAETMLSINLCGHCEIILRNPPCKGCTDRKLGCRAKCKRHTKWHNTYNAYKSFVDSVRKKDALTYDNRKKKRPS